MLESFLKRAYTYVVGGVVVLLSVVFALQFGGPQAEGCSAGGAMFAAKVYGQTISEGDFRAAYVLAGFDRYPPQVAEQNKFRQVTLNGLIERALLARAARDIGLRVSEEDVWGELAEKGTTRLSLGVDAPDSLPSGEIPIPVRNRDGDFDEEAARRFIQYGLRRSVQEYGEAQVEELLAQRMRDTILASVEVSPREIWESYVRERDQVTLKYVRFTPSYYRDTLEVTDAAVTEWTEENAERVDREYQANRFRYTGLDPQVHARHILIKASPDASEDLRAVARQRAQALLARSRAGEDFAALARENSEDTETARRGGDLGFNPRGRMVAPFDEAQFSLEAGQISDIVESRFGFHIIQVLAKREGDVPEAEAKQEIGERLFRESRAEDLARRAARDGLAALREGTSMDELDTRLGNAIPEPESESPEGEDNEPAVDPLAPRVETTRPFGRGGAPITAAFDNGPLVRAAFELTDEAPLPEEPIQLGTDFFVIRLEERQVASQEGFTDEIRDRIHEGLTRAKEREALRVYVHALRQAAESEGALRINEEILAGDSPGAEQEEEAPSE